MIFFPEASAGWGIMLAMLTYNVGQGLIALGAVITMSARQPSRDKALATDEPDAIALP